MKNYILACFQHTFLGLITLVTVFIVSHSFAGFIKLLIQFPFSSWQFKSSLIYLLTVIVLLLINFKNFSFVVAMLGIKLRAFLYPQLYFLQ